MSRKELEHHDSRFDPQGQRIIEVDGYFYRARDLGFKLKYSPARRLSQISQSPTDSWFPGYFEYLDNDSLTELTAKIVRILTVGNKKRKEV